MAPRELGDQKRGDGGRVTEGPVVQTHEPFDQRHRIRLHDELRVMRRAVRGHLTRIRRLVERRIAGEAKAERLDGLADQSAHQRHHHARIHPAAQKRPERNIRDEPFSHRLGDERAHGPDRLALRRPRALRPSNRQVPVPPAHDLPVTVYRHPVGRRELPNAAVERLSGRRISEDEIVRECLHRRCRGNGRMPQHRLHLRAEHEAVIGRGVEEGLLAGAVARE